MNTLTFEELEHFDINGAHVRIGSSQLGGRKKFTTYATINQPLGIHASR